MIKITLQNGIIIEGDNADDLVKFTKQEKPIVTNEPVSILRRKKDGRYRKGIRRAPWTGAELAKIMETINEPIRKVMALLPSRTMATIGNIRWQMKGNRLDSHRQETLEAYLREK